LVFITASALKICNSHLQLKFIHISFQVLWSDTFKIKTLTLVHKPRQPLYQCSHVKLIPVSKLTTETATTYILNPVSWSGRLIVNKSFACFCGKIWMTTIAKEIQSALWKRCIEVIQDNTAAVKWHTVECFGKKKMFRNTRFSTSWYPTNASAAFKKRNQRKWHLLLFSSALLITATLRAAEVIWWINIWVTASLQT